MTTQLFFEGDLFFQSLEESLQKAQNTIDIEVYTFADDELGIKIQKLLIQKAQARLRVRLIYDAIGCRSTSEDFFEEMKLSGVQVVEYNPIWFSRNYFRRNHRKMIVVDQIGFIGGYNFAIDYSAEYAGETAWRDTGAKIDDPKLVSQMREIFEKSWQEKDPSTQELFMEHVKLRKEKAKISLPCFVASYGWPERSVIREQYLQAVRESQRYIYLTSAYFVPDFRFLTLLIRAARRGVSIILLTAGESDVLPARWASQSVYERLLKVGVRIFEYQHRVLHAKTAVVDEHWYTVGTANLDHLSLFHTLEVNLIANDPENSRLLKEQFFTDLENSREVILNEWKKRPWWLRLLNKMFFIFRMWL